MRLGAHVLLPKDFDTHPDAKYPLALFHGHFPADFEGFRPEPPEEELEPDLATRFALPIPGVSTANSQQPTAHAWHTALVAGILPRSFAGCPQRRRCLHLAAALASFF